MQKRVAERSNNKLNNGSSKTWQYRPVGKMNIKYITSLKHYVRERNVHKLRSRVTGAT